ncbi:MAG: RNA polymerase sigma factor [Saprospiraceae bacterium]|nr:RNA polymerase sigma factor [Saprospiraceae bacterium]MBL0024690.1 RNA polymerase sigma factor [Saprospiraceae bacterium]
MLNSEDTQILNMIESPELRNQGYQLLVNKFKEKLYWHIRRIVLDHDDADDVLQNTFMKVVRKIDGFQHQSSLFTWLYRIATNESLNFINNKKNRKTEHIEDTLFFKSAGDNLMDEKVILNLLQLAINRLPEKQKLVFNMRYYDEMSYQEISDITETSTGALKASYHHAVKKIEEQLKAGI